MWWDECAGREITTRRSWGSCDPSVCHTNGPCCSTRAPAFVFLNSGTHAAALMDPEFAFDAPRSLSAVCNGEEAAADADAWFSVVHLHLMQSAAKPADENAAPVGGEPHAGGVDGGTGGGKVLAVRQARQAGAAQASVRSRRAAPEPLEHALPSKRHRAAVQACAAPAVRCAGTRLLPLCSSPRAQPAASLTGGQPVSGPAAGTRSRNAKRPAPAAVATAGCAGAGHGAIVGAGHAIRTSRAAPAHTAAACGGGGGGGGGTGGADLDDLKMLLQQHNKKFRNHTYEPRQHSVRHVRMVRLRTGMPRLRRVTQA